MLDAWWLYPLLKTIHIVSFTAWMAGLFYLPRLFVYHCQVAQGSEQDALFQTMERKLMRFIMKPAMISTWVFGLATAAVLFEWEAFSLVWLWLKLACVIGLSAFHDSLNGHIRRFAKAENVKPERYFRLINEVPTVLLIFIVALVVFQPT